MRNFLVNLSVVTALAGAISYFMSLKFPALDFSMATILCIYFFGISAITYNILIKSAKTQQDTVEQKKNNSRFFNRFLLATVIKFFLSVLILGIYVFVNQQEAVSFILLFASGYFLFTSFEVYSLMQFFKEQKLQ